MGVILTVTQPDSAQDRYHVGCKHQGAAYTWYVSDDGHWLVVKSESGVPREQVPMERIRRLLVEQCAYAEPEPEQVCVPKFGEDLEDHTKHGHVPGGPSLRSAAAAESLKRELAPGEIQVDRIHNRRQRA